ncbi:aspartate racemase [Cordyceps fumosorosea ARSEF 2679]|uniref:Aspartate racemase n=1 Tax=Cordyceps fumosorosea (strain ARSEF 2679) TaxID=1081104 RepID=A0A168B3T1_CORFA|nr:aspartate racemase [Cordyceps fumosorosea ARSEF 2679]OAA69581.1 aspartate racemase [Cordyceps fumosorosea ARSEF 2679]
MKTIGIIDGSTDIATAEYYRIINATCTPASAHYVQNELWDEGGACLATKARSLERAGGDSRVHGDSAAGEAGGQAGGAHV